MTTRRHGSFDLRSPTDLALLSYGTVYNIIFADAKYSVNLDQKIVRFVWADIFF